jgi:chemotaxis protein MotB
MNSENQQKTEILVIRRSSSDDGGGHHGGAWKIAYADFVTAMMAFFLVMWLINSANEATRARVASYFNPIKMTDATPGGRELKDVNNPKKSEGKAKPETSAEKASDATDHNAAGKVEPTGASASKASDDPLHDPYKTIELISADGQAHASGRTVEVVSEKAGDPFDPKAWEALREGKQNTDASSADSAGGDPTLSPVQEANARPQTQANENTKLVGAAASSTAPSSPDQGQVTKPATDAAKASHQPADSQGNDKALQEMADRATQQIQQAIVDAGAATDLKVSAKVTSEGLLIVLSDQNSQPMFTLGAAKPTPALIEVISTIGSILNSQEGKVVVRGHTDARQYRSGSFDNWQLSTARAHMASYILIHGGLDEQRILKIEGYGASEPLDATDPFADENRRVEFLLRK